MERREGDVKGHRRSLRLPSYDYAHPGAYFVTICTQGRKCLFGAIADGEMRMNHSGRMVEEWWMELKNKFPSVAPNELIIMPNHIHGIITVGEALCGSTGGKGRPHRGAPTLGEMIGWFKTMTTNEYIRRIKSQGWPPFQDRLWQRNYYEHVIRNEDELEKIQEYISFNPRKWDSDRENPGYSPSPTETQEEIGAILGGKP